MKISKQLKRIKGLIHRPDQCPVSVNDMSILSPRNTHKRYTVDELMAQCDPDVEMSEEMKAWDRMVPVGREIIE